MGFFHRLFGKAPPEQPAVRVLAQGIGDDPALPLGMLLDMCRGRLNYLTPGVPSLASVVEWIDAASATPTTVGPEESLLRRRVTALHWVLLNVEVALQAPDVAARPPLQQSLAQAVIDATRISDDATRDALSDQVERLLAEARAR